MSTLTFDQQQVPGGAERRAAGDQRPSLVRLAQIELRKMVDTRSGFWVLLGVAVITVLFALISAANHGGRGGTYLHVFHTASQPLAFLLPVLGVLLICGEWTQRTTLSTFTLVPVRRRVIEAKVLACVSVAAAALVLTVVVTLMFVSIFGHAPGGAGTLALAVIAQGWLHLIVWMLIGLAFGSAFLLSAPAIVAYLLLPTLWDGIVGGVHSLSAVATWLDAAQSFFPLTLHALSATEWAHVLATMALWLGLPLIIGLRRARGDL